MWSIGWLVVGLLAGVVVWAIEGEDDAVLYTTVYLVERSLSLDNLFVFLLLFAYFARAGRAAGAAPVLGHRVRARCCAASRSSAESR